MSVTTEKILDELTGAIKSIGNTKVAPYDSPATLLRVDDDGTGWVHFEGGVDETPVRMTINASEGDIVQVRVSGGDAFLVGNSTAPPTDDTQANIANKKANSANMTAVQAQESADEARKTATNYMSSDHTGVMIADLADGLQLPQTATGRNVKIDNDSVDIRNGQDVLASFGEVVHIGDSNASHLTIREKEILLQNDNQEKVFQITNDGDVHPKQVYEDVLAESYVFPRELVPGTQIFVKVGHSFSDEWETRQENLFIFTAGTYETFRKHTGGGSLIYCIGYRQNGDSEEIYIFDVSQMVHKILITYTTYYTMLPGNYYTIGLRTGDLGEESYVLGNMCEASGKYSHAHNIGTIAKGDGQTVIGQYNIPDYGDTYSFIIGNGTTEQYRNNALGIDWHGDVRMELVYAVDTISVEGKFYNALNSLGWINEVSV